MYTGSPATPLTRARARGQTSDAPRDRTPSALSKKIREIIIANLTHLICGRMGKPADADLIAKAMGGQTSTRRGNDNDDGPAPIHSRDLLKMAQWHFTCQVTQQGELSSAFQLKSINVDQTWAHLKTDRNITQQITANTGLVSVEQRLDHYDTLPEKIAHWLQTGQPITTEKMIERQHQNIINHQPNPPSINGSNPRKHARPQPTAPTTPTELFTAWANACVVEATPHTITPTAALTTSHSRWCQQNNTQPVFQRVLQQLIANKWGPSETARIGGKVTRIRRGIKLRPPASVTGM